MAARSSERWAESLSSTNRPQSISPGLVKTEFRGRLEKRSDPNSVWEDVEGVGGSPALESQDVVDAIIYALATPPRMQVHDILMRNVHQQR